MAITNYLVHFKTETTFNANKNQLRNDAVAFVGDATIIHTHGTDYYCGSGPVALKSELATVATTGSYNDLIDLPEDSENVYLLDLTALGNLGVSSIEKNIGTDAYTNLANAINNKQLICILGLTMTLNTIIPTVAAIDDSGTILITYNNMESEYNFIISSDGNCSYTYTENSISASKVIGLAEVATSGSYNDLSDKPEIPNVSELATKSELSNYLPLSGGNMSGAIDFSSASTNTPIKLNGKQIDLGGGFTIGDYGGTFKYGDKVVLTEANWEEYISFIDTKNTTGTLNNTSKLYLAGGTSQSNTGVVTYSNINVYTQSGQLYATQMNATNGFYETSDARLKNFKDDIKALDVVSEIPTKYFTWKKDETDENSDPKLHIGTSAQEIQKLYPDLVTENEEGELSVDYARLSVIALAAIKELKKEINMLKSASVKYKF